MQYSKHVISGFAWQSLLKVGLAGLSLIKIFILARIFSPSDFGVFALIAIALGVSEATTQTGVNITILQTLHDPKKLIDTSWLIAIVRGGLIAGILAVMGFLMSVFFKNPQLFGLSLLACLVPMIKGLINPSIAIWQKEFQFQKDTFFHLLVTLIEIVGTILLALVWPNVAVFIYGMIIAALAEVIISFVAAKPKPKLIYDKQIASIIFQNAKGLSITAILSYLVENLDDLILGKTLGTYQLGLYHNGYAIAHKFTYEPGKAANYSLLSVYTKLTDNPKRLWSGFIKALTAILLLLGLITIAVINLKQIIVGLVLGSDWQEVVPIISWLTIAGFFQTAIASIYTYLIAQKKYLVLNWHLAINVILMSVGLYWTSSTYGLLTAVGILAIIRIIMFFPLILFVYFKRN